jgi:hypothetical protein
MESIKKECGMIQAELECVIPSDINAVIDHAKNIAVYHARAGQMLADAKMLLRKKKSSEIADMIVKIAKGGYLSSKAQNALVESIAQEENYLVDWLDRINSMCVHQLDLCRTIISKEKEEMKFTNNYNFN